MAARNGRATPSSMKLAGAAGLHGAVRDNCVAAVAGVAAEAVGRPVRHLHRELPAPETAVLGR